MDQIINLSFPHIGEQIFKNFSTTKVLEFSQVSKTWKVLAENVIVKRWRGKLPRILKTLKSSKSKVIELLLEHSKIEAAELNQHFNGMTLFMWACKNGHIDVVKLLLERSDFDFNDKDSTETKNTAFMWACQNGHQDIVKTLLEEPSDRIDYNAISGQCKDWIVPTMTAFVIACKSGQKEVVKLLLNYSNSKNIEVNGEEGLSWTLVMLSDLCRTRPHEGHVGHVAVVKLLLDQNITNIDFNAKVNSSSSPILKAGQTGSLDVVKLFLDYADAKNIDLNAADYEGKTLLLYACRHGKEDLFKLLLDYSGKSHIDWNAKDDCGWTAFTWACIRDNKFMAQSLMDLSERYHIDLNAKDDEGMTAIMHLYSASHKDFLKFLLKYSKGLIDWNAKQPDGDNLLMNACRSHYPEIVKLLLKHAQSKGIEVPEPDYFWYIEQPTIDLLRKYKIKKTLRNFRNLKLK